MALKNLKNNFSFYALYLLSVSFVITIFFAFTSFSMNTVMLEKISNDGRVETMCNTISVFLMAFVVFYMSYSNRFFLRRRTKELGIYALLGYRTSTILSLLTTENLLTCSGAFIVGIFLGGFFHKGIVFGITKLLDLSVNHSEIPFFNPNAIMKTTCFILVVVIVLALSNSRFLFRASLMDLVRYEKSAEKKMKFHAIPSVIDFGTIIAGYCLALDILRGAKSLWLTVGFYPVGMLTFALILAGTMLFIASSLPFAVQAGKKNKKRFYTETKIITAPGFIYHIHSNSRTLIMLTLLSTATLTVSSIMALSLYYPIAAVSRIAPSEIECRIDIFVYRLLKELVTNVYRHSAGENAWITLRQDSGIIMLCIKDNGTTSADTLLSADLSKHRGLSLITDRVGNMGGSVKITDNFPHGVCIQITLPMKGDVSYQYFIS